jgi:hypothetical protein
MHTVRTGRLGAMALALMVASCGMAQAQGAREAAAEGQFGWAGFEDDATKHHTVFGGALRLPLTDRLSVGPEIVYMRGPNTDRDVFFYGTLWYDLVARHSPVVPYLVAGGGLLRHSDEFQTGTFVTHEGSFTAGGGARVRLGPRAYVGGDLRLGWELHVRATAHVGMTWPSR